MIYTDTKTLMKSLKLIMINKEISNKELADKLNLTSGAISGVFSQRNITLNKLRDLCDALDCDIDISFVDRKSGTPQ